MKRVILISTPNGTAFKVDQKERSMFQLPKCNDESFLQVYLMFIMQLWQLRIVKSIQAVPIDIFTRCFVNYVYNKV
jgi:hypothetical protein